MTKLLVLYNQPRDPAAFDRYYFATHVPLAQKIPRLRTYIVSREKPRPLGSGAVPHLVAELHFDSAHDLEAAMASPQGQAAKADLENFADAGATMLAFETKTVG
jgi:uncharacterized protein (TIGR02118 family)